ncbi:MAG: hypothetical protein VKN83_07395 [Cyanobacteriota bacterium]|nr:hypothetical protein [Cyanobacteriota bacterium]
MTASSVSFRITRHTEDLAQTIHALSQRVVQLEQRLAGLEDHLSKPEEDDPLSSEQLTSLANVDQLLRDCRELLGADSLEETGAAVKEPTSLASRSQSEDEDEALDDVA